MVSELEYRIANRPYAVRDHHIDLRCDLLGYLCVETGPPTRIVHEFHLHPAGHRSPGHIGNGKEIMGNVLPSEHRGEKSRTHTDSSD